MLICHIEKPNNVPMAMKKLLIPLNIQCFSKNLSKKFDLNFQILDSKYDIFKSTVYIADQHYESEDEYNTYFAFITCNKRDAIYIHGLTLPVRLQRKGIGSYCVNWLKDLCKAFGFKYIILASYPDAKAFWQRMGFKEGYYIY